MKRFLTIFFVIINFSLFAEVVVDILPVGKKQSTGVYFKKGEKVSLTATGKWTLWYRYNLVGPEGHPDATTDYGNWGVLLGKIGGGEIFVVSNKKDLTSDADGILYLFPSKGKYLIEKENGSLKVTINGGQTIQELINSFPPNTKKISYNPKSGILNTNLFFNENEKIEIYAFGIWNMWDGYYKETNAEGHNFEFNPENIPWGKLHGGIGSSYGFFFQKFQIGEKNSIETSQSGILSLYPYLSNYISAKSGNLDIYIIGGREVTPEDIKVVDEKAKLLASNIALNRINEYRTMFNLPILELDPKLCQSAFLHSKYVAINNSFTHNQDESLPNFLGFSFKDRLEKVGYKGRAREMFCQIDSTPASVELLFDSIYHRLRLMDPEIKYLGYGNYIDNERSIHVFDLGYVSDDQAKFEWESIEYPKKDSKDNKVSWDGTENPNPMPLGIDKPFGFPITLLLKEPILTVTKKVLLDEDNKEVECFFITPENDVYKKQINAVIIVPLKPLVNGKKYTVEINLKIASGEDKIYKWSFDTINK